MAKSSISPLPVIASAAAAAAGSSAASFDDEDEDFDDDDPFEDWDDLPSISPAGSSSLDGEGGIASLRSFTDALRGEVRVAFPF